MHARSFATVSSKPHLTQSVIFVFFWSVMEKVKVSQNIMGYKNKISFETFLKYNAPARFVVRHPMMAQAKVPRHVDTKTWFETWPLFFYLISFQ